MAVLHSTLLYNGSISLYFTINVPWLYFILLDSTLFYHGSTSLYINVPWLYFILLDSALFYHGSTSLYSTLHRTTDFTLLYSGSSYLTLLA